MLFRIQLEEEQNNGDVSERESWGGTDIWDDIDSSLWQDMTVYNNRLPSGYVAKCAVIGKTAYIYISFYEINKTNFGTTFDYWNMFNGSNVPKPVRLTPLEICDRQGAFLSADVLPTSANRGIISIVGNPENYDNSKGSYFTTVVQGQYQI